MKLLITTQAIDKNDPILGFFHRWVEEFAKHFEHIHIICLKEGVHTLPHNVTVHSLGKESGESKIKYFIRFYMFFFKVFFIEKVDVVFFHMGAIYNILALPFFLARKFMHTKFVWWKTHGLLNQVGKIGLWCVDEVVTAGSKSFNAPSKKIRVVGHAIDTDAFSYIPRVNENSVLKMLMVGRVTPIKKIEVALETISYFREIINTEILLDIYGPVTDVSYSAILSELTKKYNIQSCVTFFPAHTPVQMREIYQKYDALIHPSYEAGFDKVVLEAMATGIFPITSIQSFETILSPFGLYVPANNVKKYSEVCNRIQKMNSNERKILREKLRKIVTDSHSISTLPERIFSVL